MVLISRRYPFQDGHSCQDKVQGSRSLILVVVLGVAVVAVVVVVVAVAAVVVVVVAVVVVVVIVDHAAVAPADVY